MEDWKHTAEKGGGMGYNNCFILIIVFLEAKIVFRLIVQP